jgi:sugar lactone lactonase YvrE
MLPQTGPEFLAVAATSVYLTTTNVGGVVKVPIGGGSPVMLAAGQNQPISIAVDDVNVYWTNEGGSGSVMKVPVGGGTPTTLASGQGAAFGIAVDTSSVYWTTITGNHAVMKVAIAGGAPTVLAPATSPWAIVVHDGSVYFTDGDDVMVVPAAGGAAVTMAAAQQFPSSLAVDATNLYWASSRGAGTIVQMPLAGGTPTTLASSTGFARIAVYGTNVYCTSPGVIGPNDGTVVRFPIGGGAPTTLVDGQASPEGIAVDANGVYWLDTGIGAVMGLTPK